MPKWEYSVLRGLFNTSNEWRVMYPRLYRFTGKGAQLVTDFQKRDPILTEQAAVAQMIAQLGEEGWEMFAVANDGSGSSHCLYFKRAKIEAVNGETSGDLVADPAATGLPAPMIPPDDQQA